MYLQKSTALARDEYITILFRKYLAGTYTRDELDALLRYFELEEASDQLTELIEHALANPAPEAAHSERVKAIRDRVADRLTVQKPRRMHTRWLPYAAAALIVVTAAAWLFFGDQERTAEIATVQPEDIAPGGNRATLTLAGGRTINLSESQAGIVVGDGITYLDGSEVANAGKESLMADVSHLMSVSTPKGGTYQVTLPDGSSVWLNANSTLKYPSRFSDEERVVELIGEGYFDVNRRESAQSVSSAFQPFKVITSGQTVEVLGTEFNISAYTDEPETQTTLVEGSVKVSNLTSHISKLLKPGEQATMREAAIQIRQVDVNDFIAWKNGYIVITNATLADVITQVERWYDVDFDVKSQSDVTAYVSLNRTANLSEVLEALELNYGIKFKIAGRRVIEQD